MTDVMKRSLYPTHTSMNITEIQSVEIDYGMPNQSMGMIRLIFHCQQ